MTLPRLGAPLHPEETFPRDQLFQYLADYFDRLYDPDAAPSLGRVPLATCHFRLSIG